MTEGGEGVRRGMVDECMNLVPDGCYQGTYNDSLGAFPGLSIFYD